MVLGVLYYGRSLLQRGSDQALSAVVCNLEFYVNCQAYWRSDNERNAPLEWRPVYGSHILGCPALRANSTIERQYPARCKLDSKLDLDPPYSSPSPGISARRATLMSRHICSLPRASLCVQLSRPIVAGRRNVNRSLSLGALGPSLSNLKVSI